MRPARHSVHSAAAQPPVPRHLAAALAIAACFAAFVTWDQWHWWGSKPDYMFGYIVPVFVAYVVHERWSEFRRLAAATTVPAAPGWMRAVVSIIAGVALAGGLAFFALGAFLRAGSGASQPASLAMALGFGAIALGMIYFASGTPGMPGGAGPAPVPAPAGGFRALLQDPRLRIMALFLFPALVWIISAPLVSAVEGALSRFLLHKVTVVVFFVFDSLGFLLERQGNVLVLPDGKGTVGVAEACSGIRSLTGSIFSGAFLAAVFLDSLWRKAALIGAAIVMAFFTNILRSLFLTAWAYAYGAEAIEGSVHDVTGFAVLGVTFVGLLCLIPVFNFRLSNLLREPAGDGRSAVTGGP